MSKLDELRSRVTTFPPQLWNTLTISEHRQGGYLISDQQGVIAQAKNTDDVLAIVAIHLRSATDVRNALANPHSEVQATGEFQQLGFGLDQSTAPSVEPRPVEPPAPPAVDPQVQAAALRVRDRFLSRGLPSSAGGQPIEVQEDPGGNFGGNTATPFTQEDISALLI